MILQVKKPDVEVVRYTWYAVVEAGWMYCQILRSNIVNVLW